MQLNLGTLASQGGYSEGKRRHELAQSDPDAPHIELVVRDDLRLRLIGQEPGPLGCAVAWGEGDGGVVDGDFAADGHAAVHVDELQSTVEHHQVLGFEVEVNKALCMQPGHDEEDGTCTSFDGLT